MLRQLFRAAGESRSDSEEDRRRSSAGRPTIADRVAQTVVKLWLEPQLDPLFHADSYGYRPERSAHDAIAIARVGIIIGSPSSTSKVCSTTSIMSS